MTFTAQHNTAQTQPQNTNPYSHALVWAAVLCSNFSLWIFFYSFFFGFAALRFKGMFSLDLCFNICIDNGSVVGNSEI